MGVDRSTISNYIRLLELPPSLQAALRSGSLSVSLAKLLLGKEIEKQLFLFKEITEKGLTVKQTEELIRKMNLAGKAFTPSLATTKSQLSTISR